MLTFFFRCLSKNGSGVIHLPPLQASWIVKACCVLHNMCLDWGLRKLRPGQNKDPDHELDIRIEAQKLFNKHNPHLNPDNISQTEEVYQ